MKSLEKKKEFVRTCKRSKLAANFTTYFPLMRRTLLNISLEFPILGPLAMSSGVGRGGSNSPGA
ncbi:unnamed protein product [Periconia digitata]|uniref:Uncharacterized protein n=1 Tax=Periconia digitata TaxID=1303443 RepID=A0A9W4XPM0_9PLEO|nr:unnamed protein product [Periconia digitata]